MSAAAPGFSPFGWGERPQPGYARSFALAFAIHAVLLAVMFLGVRFQSHPPETVTVELWEPPPAPRVAEPPRPLPKVEPPKPEPRIEKPEIVEKPAPKPKPKPEAKPKPEVKPAPKDDREFKKRMQEELAREQATLRDQQAKEMLAREQAGARAKALASWVDKIRLKIRSNINLPQDLAGNPEAVFDVALLPTGEVLTVRMRKSSGHKGYDEAVERAILKSSPLPKPDQPNLFERQLELRFRPQDK
jgi:colicin import membrane protein